jgi:t-SNARE complex subunit (syntaxin)
MVLSECFTDVASELEKQREQLDLIESNVEVALEEVEGGISELVKVGNALEKHLIN